MEHKKWIIPVGTSLVVIIVLYILLTEIRRKQARVILDKKVSSQAKLNLVNAFNTSRWKTGDPKISDASARSIAQKINGSIGWFSEDEDKINQAFYGIKAYDDLSLIAYQYQQLYSKDLYSAIKSAYSGDDMKLARLRTIIASKIQMK